MPCQRVPLAAAARDQLVATTVARLRAGELCALPTETVYGVAALPGHAVATQRLRALLLRRQEEVFALHLAHAADATPLLHRLAPPMQRLLERYWPGPLTAIVPARGGGEIGLRVPAHDFTRKVIAAMGEPLWLAALQRPGEAACTTAEQIEAEFNQQLDLLIDDGPSPLGMPSTIVRWASGKLHVLREGILLRDDVLQTAAALMLFVCTGNTCRSPLAAAAAAAATGEALRVPVTDLLAHGFLFASAGTSATDGDPASDGSCAAGAEIGLDLHQHQSRALTPELVHRAHRIYCLAQGHRRAVLAEMPEACDKITLLRPDQLDVADPYGGDTLRYRRACKEIVQAVRARLTEWLPDAPANR